MVAVTVALLATFLGICKVKDDNICQAMQQEQAKSIDTWAWYQARKIRIDVDNSAITQLRLQMLAAPPAARAAYAKAIAGYQAEAKRKAASSTTRRKRPRATMTSTNAYNYHDDQFDLSDALMSISIALLAMTSLTQKRWLFGVAMVPTFFGVLMGLAGLFGWHIHSDLMAKWLGT